jgi:hypothetical protein
VIARAWARWEALLATREGPGTLALVRILLGSVLVAHLAHMTRVGAVELVWTDRAHGGLRVLDAWPFPVATPAVAYGMVAATIVAGSAWTLGAWTRVSGVLTWAGFRWLADLNGSAGGSYDEVFLDALFVLLWSGCGAAWSVDAWRAGRRGEAPPMVPAWPRWVLLGQLVTIYASTGLHKLSVSWLPVGPRDALWYILSQPDWQRRAMELPAQAFPLTQAATALTWCWEVGAPVLLLAAWARRTAARGGAWRRWLGRVDLRVPWLAVGVLMHLSIEAIFEVGPFSFAMLALYPAAWSPSELRAYSPRPKNT